MLLTIIIVISGFLGRYIYTAVPRNADGIEIEANELEEQIQLIDGELQDWLATKPALYIDLSRQLAIAPLSSGSKLVFGRAFEEWNARVRWYRARSKLDKNARMQAKQLNTLLKRERILRRQLNSIAMTRRLLGLWHVIHVPVGIALFTAAFLHILGAIYYATLLH